MKLIKLYIILLFVVTAPVIKAQIIITTPYEFSVGVSGGATLSSFTFSPKVSQKMLIGNTFGITGRMTMGEYVGLQLEFNYTQQGWDEYYEEAPDFKYSRTLDYLQLPFYTRVQFGGKNVKGFLNAGPQIGYMIGESTAESHNIDPPNKIDAQRDMPVENKFEWGVGGGAGMEIRTGIGYFLLEGRFSYMFNDIYSTKRSDTFTKASVQTIMIKASYLIPFK